MAMSDGTNPKDLLGVKKVQMNLFPPAGRIYGALAMKNGADKYGPYNWRKNKVKYTVYLDALERHLVALYDGENLAADSGLPHLAHIIANAAILADALESGNLIDDRPTPGPASRLLEQHTAAEPKLNAGTQPQDGGFPGGKCSLPGCTLCGNPK